MKFSAEKSNTRATCPACLEVLDYATDDEHDQGCCFRGFINNIPIDDVYNIPNCCIRSKIIFTVFAIFYDKNTVARFARGWYT